MSFTKDDIKEPLWKISNILCWYADFAEHFDLLNIERKKISNFPPCLAQQDRPDCLTKKSVAGLYLSAKEVN